MKTRLITSAVGIVIGITVIMLSHTILLNFSVAAITVIMLHELFGAAKCNNSKVMMAVCYIFALFNPFSYFFESLAVYRGAVAIVGVMIMFGSYINGHKELKFENVFFMICSTALITYSMGAIIELRTDSIFGNYLIIISLCGAWIADSGAYFAGTFLGKHKLCPEISPKKTVEGFIGGVLVNGIFFVVYSMIYHKIRFPEYVDMVLYFDYVKLFILGILCAVIGTLGDLTASIIKRQCNIKDYGKIMPGHGGLLDRFDSVLFVVPFVYTYVNAVGFLK